MCVELSLGFLQFVIALDGVSLIFGSPLGHLTVGLGHGSLELSLGLLLLLELLPQQITVMTGRMESISEGVLSLTQRQIWTLAEVLSRVKHFVIVKLFCQETHMFTFLPRI